MITKHTPGPWTLETVQTSCGICHKIGPFPWRDGEPNHACIYVDNRHHANANELLANARLIAAAPTLLKALSALVRHAEADNERYGLGGCPEIELQDARAAIAVATED